MKRLLILALVAGAAAVAWYQATASPRPLAQLLPGGALVYLEARDFARLLADWDGSGVKQDWLKSANYDEFQRSNLYLKLNVFYKAYGAAAGFLPDMASLRSLAGDESALALYDLRNVQFAYITRISESKAAQSRLWTARGSFETRQAAGITFYTRTSGDVELAFAVSNGYLLVSTGEERMAGMLGLLTGKNTPNIAAEAWYKNPTDAAGAAGDLRLAMNLESLVENTYFRSYWVQRNVSDARRFVSGVADIHRTSGEIQEQRLFLKRVGLMEELPTPDALTAAAALSQMAPNDDGLDRVWAAPGADEAASTIEIHLLNPHASGEARPTYAPGEDQTNGAGSEADLETRIDEPPLPKLGESGSGALQTLLTETGVLAMLEAESSKARPASPFIDLPCAIALTGRKAWNVDRVKDALGVDWVTGTHGAHTLYRANGLGRIQFASEGPVLVIANDETLLSAILGRQPNGVSAMNAAYAADFRHDRERVNFGRMMTALDFAQNRGNQEPPFFSANLESLSSALRRVSGISIVERNLADRVEQRIVYRLTP
jgi:hypothetical protein